MVATPARIGFVLQEFRVVKSEDAGALAAYGKTARRSDVIATFFEDEDDAQAICSERRELLAADRRLFQQSVSGTDTAFDLDYTSAPPVVNVIDDEHDADHAALVSEIGIDFVNNVTIVESWG